jgi:hypothetical protein
LWIERRVSSISSRLSLLLDSSPLKEPSERVLLVPFLTLACQ